jgi:hypothetical protein
VRSTINPQLQRAVETTLQEGQPESLLTGPFMSHAPRKSG